MKRLLAALLLFPSLALAAGFYTGYRQAGGSVHYYQVNESNGSTMVDSGGGTLINGTYTGFVGGNLGNVGIPGNPGNTAVKLGGTEGVGSIAVTTSTTFYPSTTNGQAFTMEAWTKLATQGAYVFGARAASVNPTNYWLVETGAAAILATIYQDTSSCNGSAAYMSSQVNSIVTTGTWHYVVMATKGNGSNGLSYMRVYWDGVKIIDNTSGTGNVCTANRTTPFIGSIGSDAAAGSCTTCVFDEIVYGNTEIADAAIAGYYQFGITGSAGWPFTTKRPRLPHFRNDDYFDQAVARGYNTGQYAFKEPIPQFLKVGFDPFSAMPPGNIGAQRPHGRSTTFR